MSPPPDIDALSSTDLKSLVLELFEKLAESQRTIAALRDEIARLKGGPGRPDIKANIKPSGMEKASEPEPRKPLGKGASTRRRTRETDDPRGAQARGRCARRFALQRLCELRRAGFGGPPARHRLSSGMLADPGRQDGDGAVAAGRRRTFRA